MNKKTAMVNLCVCCENEPHAAYSDRDLNGYVCSDCAIQLRFATEILAQHGLTRSINSRRP